MNAFIPSSYELNSTTSVPSPTKVDLPLNKETKLDQLSNSWIFFLQLYLELFCVNSIL